MRAKVNCMQVMRSTLTLLCLMFLCTLNAVAQQLNVTGSVKDALGEYIIGASVLVKGTTNGTITDIDGNFSVSGVEKGSVLEISYIGYVSQSITINDEKPLQIILKEDSETLEEVVVVGYGVQKKANLTGAVTSMKSDELLKSRAANATTALVGQMPGLISKQASGEPGADDASIFIRGIATFQGDASPAYIIDGIERTSADFARMDPNDIESINVLKDAASAAIFGMRGANGVIVITTKRGTDGKASIKYSGSVSIQSPTKLPEFANSYDYARLANQYFGSEIYSAEAIQKYKDGSDPELYPNTNWYDEMLTKNAIQNQHNISISGGNEKIRYYVSGGFLNQGGLWEDLNYKRYNLRSNIDAQITKTTRLGVDVSGRLEKSLNSGSSYTIFKELVRNTPVLLCRYPDGTFAFPDATHPNIVAANQPGGSYSKGETFVVDARVELEQELDFITEGLSAKGVMSYSRNNYTNKAWSVSPYVYSKDANNEYVLNPRTSPSLNLTQNQTNYQEYQLQVNYNRSFGLHNVTAMAMVLARKGFSSTSSMFRNSFDSEILDQINAGNTDGQTMNAVDSETARASYMARVNYNYASKYLVEFNIRRDGSENFAPDKRWGTFASASLGWVVSEEPFFESLKNTINFLKIRGSYGTLGNDNTGGVSFPFYSRFELYQGAVASNGFMNNLGDYAFGDLVTKGLVPGAIANSLATWEKSNKANIALDATLFNNLNFTVDLFTERRTNILTQRTAEVPSSFGGILPLENIGIVNNKGIDLSLNYHNSIGKVNYSVGGNFTFARNKIVEMAEAEGTSEYMRQTGRPINGYYGYKTDGIFQSQEEIDSYAKQEVAGVGYDTQIGDIKYVDVDGNGVVNSDDMTYLGYGNIPEIIYGINGSLNWKNFDFSFLMQGAAHAQVYLKGGIILPYFNQGNLPQFWVNEAWTEENPSNRYPRLAESVHNFPATDVPGVQTYLYNASYLRLKNIEVGYTFPTSWLSRIGVTNARVYVNAQNLFTISDVPQIDPENTEQEGWTYPQMKSFNFGLSLQF
ncbi:TonB-linked outer membrane protein, SusC/RagA family [Phocaeicola plebeius DSM 17135]|uniref:TonB-linked outer membrane protein, SusC/RagA family n=1 Tax=Phocaeicola plebeius (strain DSM 17135 / JCM 12973 / CCUG 54634 / M2) TaxID=484018 RepID=B5D441_PHOPM|nr:TonB-dependent receptor [Phocaeicola plebeius]EDY94341.1 TonB-linked outer membrane protein, SusC/RagA family [Phocaeicola plebeius DSM 17135]